MRQSTKSVFSQRGSNYVNGLKQFADDVEKAVNKALPTGQRMFGNVSVFGMTWSNDTMGCLAAETDLFRVLRTSYNFTCESYIINAAAMNPERDLFYALTDFTRKYDTHDALTIYVYSGHALATWGGDFTWSGDVNPNETLATPTINWNNVRGPANICLGRVLLIFDSCAAGAGGLYDGPEMIGASGWGGTASASRVDNLTKVLTDELRLLNGKPQSVTQIYTKICREAVQNHIPDHPIHFTEKDKDSIILERIPTPSRATQSGSSSARSRVLQELGTASAKVLIGVSLAGPLARPDLQQWERWLTTNLPSMVQHIKIEAVFPKKSALVLVTVPYEVWDCLPHDQPAYHYMDGVNGSNILLPSSGSNQPPQ